MSTLDQSFVNACKDGTLVGAVLIAADKSGIFHSKAYGLRSVKDPDSPLKEDDILWAASFTKLLTSIAAMQCVERGIIRLEDDVTTYLPELGKLQVLTGFDDEGKPILTKRTRTITLRNLLTHTSGLTYDLFHPNLIRYRSLGYTEGDGGNSVPARASAPLTFEPGTSWAYGTSLDWCGKLIERLTNQSLEEYMKSSIFAPLGMTSDITFWPSKRPELRSRMMTPATRDTDSGHWTECDLPPFFTEVAEDCFGGHGVYASMPNFFKVLQSILLDDEKLLKKSTAAGLFKPQLTPEQKNQIKAIQATPEGFFGHHENVELDWSLGGGLFLNDYMNIGMENPTFFWSGLPNMNWFIDRQVGVCGLFGTQVIPPGDTKVQAMRTLFEKAIYDRVNGRSDS